VNRLSDVWYKPTLPDNTGNPATHFHSVVCRFYGQIKMIGRELSCGCGSLRSHFSGFTAELGRLIEHDGFVAITENTALQMPRYRPRQHRFLDIPALLDEILDLIPVRNAHDILFDNRTVVQCRGNVVTRRADQFYAPLEGRLVRSSAYEGR
jgi:hypothetical protein